TTRTASPARLSAMMRLVRLEKRVSSMSRRTAFHARPNADAVPVQALAKRLSRIRTSGCGLSIAGSFTGASRRRPLLLLEAVSYAVKRFDHLEFVVDRLELLAQPLDVAVDGAVVHINLVVIGRVHQRVAALDHAGPQ